MDGTPTTAQQTPTSPMLIPLPFIHSARPKVQEVSVYIPSNSRSVIFVFVSGREHDRYKETIEGATGERVVICIVTTMLEPS